MCLFNLVYNNCQLLVIPKTTIGGFKDNINTIAFCAYLALEDQNITFNKSPTLGANAIHMFT